LRKDSFASNIDSQKLKEMHQASNNAINKRKRKSGMASNEYNGLKIGQY
jgi:hypothetical protein